MEYQKDLSFWNKENQDALRLENDSNALRQEIHGTTKSISALGRLADEQAEGRHTTLESGYLPVQPAALSFDPLPIEAQLEFEDFADFADEARGSYDNYAIRTNPRTGEKEMFIYGTPGPFQTNKRRGYINVWSENIRDGFIGGQNWIMDKAIPGRKHNLGMSFIEKGRAPLESRYAEIAKKNNIDVVYGYSKGAAQAADLKYYGYKGGIVGLDGAMLNTRNKDIINITEGPDSKGYLAVQAWSDFGPKATQIAPEFNPYLYGAVYVESKKPLPEVVVDVSKTFDKFLGLSGKHNFHYDANEASPHQVWKGHPKSQLMNNFLAGYGYGDNYNDPNYDPSSGLFYKVNLWDYFND